MCDMDIIKQNDNYRVRLELDEYPEKPYDDGATPILSREFGNYYGSRWEAVNKQGEDLADELNALAGRIQRELEEEVIERYLRIFHGAYSVTFDSSENCRYVSFDTADWREKMGLTDEYMEKVGKDVLDPSTLSEGSLKEVMAWANGDVYGIIVEKLLITFKSYHDPETNASVKEEDGEEWVEVEDGSVWGFYGREYAEEEAVRMFDAEVQRNEK
ncbi:Hypothetical Protein OBI_RACECAR_312 [Arthrobacter phage Racecar]|nr:hypothetical protein PBI_RACECAR_104 [Arthrobacter phage Racecar]